MYKEIPYPYAPEIFTVIGSSLVIGSALSLVYPSSVNAVEILMFAFLCFFLAFLYQLVNLDVEYQNKIY